MKLKNDEISGSTNIMRMERYDAKISTEEASTQTQDLVPYEHLLLGVVSSGIQGPDQPSKSNSNSRLSPNFMMERYIQACARINHYGDYSKQR